MAKKTIPTNEPTAFDLGVAAAPGIPQRGAEPKPLVADKTSSLLAKTSFTLEQDIMDALKIALVTDKVKFQKFIRGCAKMYISGKLTAEQIKENQ